MPVGVGAALVGGVVGLGTGIAATAINAALFVGLSAASSALAQRELKKQGIAPRDAVVRGGDFPKIIVYGEAVVGGVMAYINQRDIGNDDFELWVALVHAAHECNSVLGVYYEDEYLEFGTQINATTFDVDNSQNWTAVSSNGVHAARAYRYDGTQTTANTEFVSAFSDITSNFRLQGYAYTLHRWTLWQGSEEIFKGGEPSNIRARIRGKQVKTSELGSPVYSSNPIWIAVDYMREYMGIPDSRFDWTDLATQAAVCSAIVADPSGNQPRYSCNGAISLGDSHDDNLQKILATCLGFRSMVNGKIRITAGGDLTSTVSLDETDIITQANGSPVPATIRTAVPREERYNKVTGAYISADAGYTSTEFQPQEEANFVTRDNGETITKQIQLDMVTDEYLAQRIAYKHLQQSDQQVTCELPLRWSGLRLTPGTYCSVTYDKFNWSSKLFRCESVRIGERGVPVTAVLREDSASAWVDPTSPGDYTQILPDGAISKPAESVPVPTSMTANPVSSFGLNGVQVKWLNPSSSATWDYVNVYASPDSSWANAVLVGERVIDGDFTHTEGLSVGDTRYYWVRATRNGVESIREPNSDTSNRTATVPGSDNLENLIPQRFHTVDPLTAPTIEVLQSQHTVEIDEAVSYFGRKSYKFTHGSGTTLGTQILFAKTTAAFTSNLLLQSGRRYLVAAFVRLASGTTSAAQYRFQLQRGRGGGTQGYSGIAFDLDGVSTGVWTQITDEITVVDGGEFKLRLFVFNNTGSGSPIVNMDGVMLLDVTDLPQYVSNVSAI